MVTTLALFLACDEPDALPVDPVNIAPEAACAIGSFIDGRLVLDASASIDPDGDPLAFRWHVEAPEGFDAGFTEGFVNTTEVAVFPVALGTYVFGVEATDGEHISNAEYCVWTLDEAEHTPVADAGPNQTIDLGQEVCFDGSGSYDPAGKSLAYAWTFIDQPERSALALAETTEAICFTPDVGGVFSVGLIVDNGQTTSTSGIAHVTVQTENTGPVANAGDDLIGQDCTWLSLDGADSVDPDGDVLHYFWEIKQSPAGSRVDDSTSFAPDRTAEAPQFYADVAGEYVLTLTVSDGEAWSSIDTVRINLGERSYNTPPAVSITAPGEIDAGLACCENLGGGQIGCDTCTDERSTLDDGVTIHDADNDPVRVLWESLDGDSTVVDPELVGTDIFYEGARPSSTGACDVTEFEMMLVVQDCTGAVTTAVVTQELTCCGDFQSSC